MSDGRPARPKLRISTPLLVLQGIAMSILFPAAMYLVNQSRLFGPPSDMPLIAYAIMGVAMGVLFPPTWAWVMRRLYPNRVAN